MIPSDLPFLFLEDITNGFSDNQKLGSGGYGEVYKGVDKNGKEIAVKRVFSMPGIDDVQFKNELNSLMKVRHQNIVRLYMAPEYLSGRQISSKSDIFSLGVMIIQIITGPEGYFRLAEMTTHHFIELVHKNWRNRIEASSMYASREEDCWQVKRCIELALDCVRADKDKRPTVREIINALKQVETEGSTSPSYKARLAKIGMWGGVGGSHDDIEVAPRHLKSLRLGSGEVIYSLEFSYYDHDGRPHTAGPWGRYGPEGHGKCHDDINFSPSEFITEVQGTICPFGPALAGVVKSLTIITNMDIYGPFGEVKGTPFRIPVQDNGCIVGFFGRAGWYLDAFGVHVNPKQETGECGLAKIGPWGGNGGQFHDITMAPHRLESVTICSSTIVDSVMFTYRDTDGRQHTAGPWGRSGVSTRIETINLSDSEYITGVYGRTGPFADASSDVVTSITLVTNGRRRFGPFGESGGTPFQIEMWNRGSIVGFFGCVESYLNAIGVYADPDQEAMPEELISSHEPGYTKIGPWGGIGGNFQDVPTSVQPHRLESMTISCGAVVNSLSYSYMDFNGLMHTVGPWGSPRDNICMIKFEPLEILQGVQGTVGPLGELPNVITSLTFATNHCRAYGPYGQGGGTPFNAPAEKDGCIVGFFGHAGSCLESLGVYVHRY